MPRQPTPDTRNKRGHGTRHGLVVRASAPAAQEVHASSEEHQHRATALEVDPSRIRMYRELDPTAARQAEAVVTGRASRGVLNVPDPWYGDYGDFVDTLAVIERSTPALVDYVRP